MQTNFAYIDFSQDSDVVSCRKLCVKLHSCDICQNVLQGARISFVVRFIELILIRIYKQLRCTSGISVGRPDICFDHVFNFYHNDLAFYLNNIERYNIKNKLFVDDLSSRLV